MNPKTPADLDPKLKEAYDRVMGGNLGQASPPPPPPAPKIETPAPAPTSVNPTPIPTPPPSSAIPTSVADTPPLNVMSPTTASSTGEQVISNNKKFKLTPKIFLIVGVVFFIVYALVWGKVFKLF